MSAATPWGYYGLLTVMGLIATGLLLVFKRKRWPMRYAAPGANRCRGHYPADKSARGLASYWEAVPVGESEGVGGGDCVAV